MSRRYSRGRLLQSVGITLAVVNVAACAPAVQTASADGADEGSPPPRLRVVATNDFHGTLSPTRPSFAEGQLVGGAATVAAYVQIARAGTDAPTILLDGGDVMQGTPISNLSRGEATVAYYNEIGYTAAAIGNHEFDWGVDVLKERIEQAEFAWLGANIFVKGTDTLPSWVEPIHMERLPGCAGGGAACDSITVGIIGIATTETPRAAMPSFVAPFDFADEAVVIDRWVPELRRRGADFVIVTAHEGAYCEGDGSGACEGAMIEIAERVTRRPDLIVSGHTHQVMNTRANGIPIIEAGQYGARVSIVDLKRVSADSVAVYVYDQPVTYVDSVAPVAAIQELVDRYQREVGPQLSEVITTLTEPLARGAPEFPLGNLIADAQRAATGADIALINNGGIRIDLPAGPVTFEDLFRLQPFANTLVNVSLTGEQVLDVLEHALGRGRPDAHISGAQVRYRADAPTGERVVRVTLEDGQPLDPSRLYRVTANNFMLDGGDGFTSLAAGRDIEPTGIVDLDALILHIRSRPNPLPVPEANRFVGNEP